MTTREQELVDIMFQVGHMIHNYEWFKSQPTEEVMKWIAGQLRGCGYYTIPMGMSWGSLCTKEFYEKHKDNVT